MAATSAASVSCSTSRKRARSGCGSSARSKSRNPPSSRHYGWATRIRLTTGEGMMRAIVLMSGFLAIAAGGGAMAGTVITLDQTVNGTPGRPQVMYLEPDRLRMSSPENDMIFRGDQNKVWVVRPEDKAYIELTPESMAQMKAQMDQM